MHAELFNSKITRKLKKQTYIGETFRIWFMRHDHISGCTTIIYAIVDCVCHGVIACTRLLVFVNNGRERSTMRKDDMLPVKVIIIEYSRSVADDNCTITSGCVCLFSGYDHVCRCYHGNTVSRLNHISNTVELSGLNVRPARVEVLNYISIHKRCIF